MAHHGEDRSIGLVGSQDPSGGHRRPGLVFEVGPIEVEQLPQEAQVERRSMERDVVHGQLEFADEQFEHLGADVVGHLEPDGLVESPPAQLHLDRFEQVVGLLLFEGEVGVAGHPEGRPVLDDHADEQPVEFRGDQLLDGEISTCRDGHQAREELGDLEPDEAPIAGLGVGDVDREREREVGDVRERVAGIDGQRGQDREDPFVEPLVEFDALVVGDVVPADDVDAGRTELGDELVDEGAVDLVDELQRAVSDLGQLSAPGSDRRATADRCRR